MPQVAEGPAPPSPNVPFRPAVLTNGVVPWLFMMSGPYLLVLSAGVAAGVPQPALISWFMAVGVFGGLATIVANIYFRRPIAIGMTIHGALVAAAALSSLSFAEAIGAYIMTALLVMLLALSGLADLILERLPLPVALGMVLGVIFPFGLNMASAVRAAPMLAGGTVLMFLLFTRFRRGSVPPIFWTALIAIVAASVLGVVHWDSLTVQVAQPIVFAPVFTLRAFVALTLPLAIMVVGVHGAQSIGITRGIGLPYFSKAYTFSAGLASLPTALLGGSPLCVVGPPLAMLVSGIRDGRDDQRWTAGVVMGVLLLLTGVFSPMLASVPRLLPGPMMAAIAGLAVLGVITSTLARAFAGPFKLGAVFAFLVTASKVSFLDIGSAFWGVVTGLAVSLVLEQKDFQAATRHRTARPEPPRPGGGAGSGGGER